MGVPGWSHLHPGAGQLKAEEERGRGHYGQARPPPAHHSAGLYPDPRYKADSRSRAEHQPSHQTIPGAPAGFRADQSYGAVKTTSPSPGPVPGYHRGGPSPHQERPHYRYSSRGQLGSPGPGPQVSPYPKAASLISPSAKSDPGLPRPPSSGPPPAHGGASKHVPGSWPPHRLGQPSHPPPPRPASATSLPPPSNGDVVPLDLGSNKRKVEVNGGGQEAGLSLKTARLEAVSPGPTSGQLHRVTEPSTLGNSVLAAEATPITSVVNTAVVSSEVSLVKEEAIKTEPQEAGPAPEEFKYVHKLKKAWIKNFVPEPDNENSIKSEARSSASVSASSSGVTSPQQRSTPSPAGSTKSTSSNKGFPSAVKSASEDLKVNGHADHENENDEEEDDFSSDNEDPKPVDKPKPRSKPGPKPKGRPGPKPGKHARKKTRSESDNNSDSDKDSDSSKNSKKSDFLGKKRGRKPGPKRKVEVEEPRAKKPKSDEAKVIADPFAKPSVAQLKKSGDSFLQDASCFEVAPKLNKCRECRGSLAQRQKQSMANIFCRFYAFRRLRYTKNGQIAVAGFCDPKQDAQIEDLKLWLPSQDLSPKNMDKENARLIIENLTGQFYSIYKAEQEAELYAEDLSPAWKRVVQGVREMCDVCEATLFNKHWACGKCGFVVCLDCYRARVNGHGLTANTGTSAEAEAGETKDKDNFSWLLCNNNKSHQLDTLMLTQIIAGDALDEVNTKLKLLSKLNRSKGTSGTVNGWENPDKNTKSPLFKDETDVKGEKEEVNIYFSSQTH